MRESYASPIRHEYLVLNRQKVKKFLFVLFAAAAMFAGCQKDSSPVVNISKADLSVINGQLKGTWLFPVQTMNVVDSTNKVLAGGQYMTAPAFQFDGSTKVTIMPDIQTKQNGTYALSTDKGYIYLIIFYPDGSSIKYKVVSADAQNLKLSASQPYTYYDDQGNATEASAVSTISLKKQTSADVTGSLVRVTVLGGTKYNVGIYVLRNTHTAGDTSVLLNSQVNLSGSYTYSFVARPSDHVKVDIFGDPSKTTFYAYYNGLALTGSIQTDDTEMVTTDGWNIP